MIWKRPATRADVVQRSAARDRSGSTLRHARSRLRDRVGVAARRRRCAPVRTIGRDRLTTPEVQQPRFRSRDWRYRRSLTRRNQMPLWHIYCPENAYSVEDKCALATRITDLYAEFGLPRFYVGVVFHELPKNSFFVGGKATNDFV